MMNLSALYRIFLDCKEVTTDSRNCPKGSLFFALKGESFNGNAYAKNALDAGCAYAVVDEKEYKEKYDDRYILVDDCLQALQLLANYHRRQLKTPIIGITGTNGKTTTKELTSTVLSQSHNVLFTMGNLNNHIGVPLTLLRLKPEHDIAVVEMGASHPGDIKLLVDIAEPDFGIITNVGKAHLEGFGSFEGVIKTKGELYDFLRGKEDSYVFIDYDNPYLMDMAKGLNQIAYGTEDYLYINGHITGNSPFLSFDWKAGEDGNRYEVETQLIGEYNFSNAMAAVTIGHYFGVSDTKINEALIAYAPQNNRSQLKKTNSNILIIDAYNANPTSMTASIDNFQNMKADRKMVILGDMKELGADSKTEHLKIVDLIKYCSFDKVWLVGSEFASIQHSFKSFANVDEVIEELKANKPEGYSILIKGSNSIKLSKIIDYL